MNLFNFESERKPFTNNLSYFDQFNTKGLSIGSKHGCIKNEKILKCSITILIKNNRLQVIAITFHSYNSKVIVNISVLYAILKKILC